MNVVKNPLFDATWERVCALFEEWTGLLEMNWLHLTLLRSDTVNDEEEGTAMDTHAQWQYRQAQIRALIPVLAMMTDEAMEGVIVHELGHVLLNPMESLLKDRDQKCAELAVENFAQAALSLKAKVEGTKRTMLKAA